MEFKLFNVTGGIVPVLAAIQKEFDATGRQTPLAGKEFIALGATVVKALALAHIKQHAVKVLTEAYKRHEELNGMYDMPLYSSEAWSDALDDTLDRLFEGYPQLSANFVGVHAIDSKLHKAGEIDKVAARFAADIWHALTVIMHRDLNDELTTMELTDAKIMSAVGLVEDDAVNITCAAPVTKTTETTETLPMATRSLEAVMNDIHARFVGNKNVHEVAKTLAGSFILAMDPDDTFAEIAVGQLGLPASDVATFKQAAKDGVTGERLTLWLVQAPYDLRAEQDHEPIDIDAAFALTAVAPPPPPAAPAPAATFDFLSLDAPAPAPAPAIAAPPMPTPVQPPKKTKAKTSEPTASVENDATLDHEPIAAIRANLAGNSETWAELLGISRTSFDNYCKGKGKLVISGDARKAFIAAAKAKVEAANLALARLMA